MVDPDPDLIQTWLNDLDPKNTRWYRMNAVQNLGSLQECDQQVIAALARVKESDRDAEIRLQAGQALANLAHQPLKGMPVQDATRPEGARILSDQDLEDMIGDDLLREQIRRLQSVDAHLTRLLEAVSRVEAGVTVKNVQLNIGSMVELLLKGMIAAIPVVILIGLLWLFVISVLGGV